MNIKNLIPIKDKHYVPHGCYNIVKTVSEKDIFAPIWISGDSGNGKTLGVEQACAAANRPLISINISNETTEDDLIGSYILESVPSYEVEISEDDYMKFQLAMSKEV